MTASTNLAVDNALDAILSLNYTEECHILRVGVPSSEFSKKWPASCEERALKQKLGFLEEEEKRIVRRLGAPSRIAEIDALLPELAADTEKLRSTIFTSTATCSRLAEQISEPNERDAALELLYSRTESSLRKSRDKRASLHYPQALEDVASLEREHVGLIAVRQSIQDELGKLSAITRLFTKKPALLRARLDLIEHRLTQVEETLGSRRPALRLLADEDSTMASGISALESKLADTLTETSGVKHELKTFGRELADIESRLAEDKATLTRFEKEAADLGLELEELAGFDPQPNLEELAELEATLERIRLQMATIKQDLSEKLVIGTTLDGFIGLTMNQAISFDHVIIDEAGYAPLAKVIPLLLLRCPISLLGDHRQLPPVYVGNNDELSKAYWGTSALYLEEAFDEGVGDNPRALLAAGENEPRFEKIRRSALTRSYRFGSELAQLLDRHFYGIELKSASTQGTSIRSVHCDPQDSPHRRKRENPSEAMQIASKVESWLDWENADKGTLAILTPYTAHKTLIGNELQQFRDHADYHRVEVMTVHKSQGREWETVFFSASDGALPGNNPFLSDSLNRKGSLVLNTAISRAKRNLRFFLDKQYWREREGGSLLTEISR